MSPLKEITSNKIKSLDRLYLCDYCKLGFDKEAALAAHAREHEGPAGNQCRLCGSGLSSKWNLRRHIERRHRLAGGQEEVKEEREEDDVRAEPEDEESKENKSEITAVCDICNKGFRGRFEEFYNQLELDKSSFITGAGSKIWRGIEKTSTQTRRRRRRRKSWRKRSIRSR